jgi:uncharacterized protein
MAYFVLEYRYGDLDARARVRPEHLAYMSRLNAEGKVVMAGPFGDGSGAMVVFRVDEEAEVRRLVDVDPYTSDDGDGRVSECSGFEGRTREPAGTSGAEGGNRCRSTNPKAPRPLNAILNAGSRRWRTPSPRPRGPEEFLAGTCPTAC